MSNTITADEYRAMLKKAPKYGNTSVSYDGYVFDSKAEARRYDELHLLEQSGAITELAVHPVYELQPAFRDTRGRRHRAIHYEGDFAYVERGQLVCEDVKGHRTAVFLLKEKLFRFRYPSIDLRIIALARGRGAG